jgi:hypothetical protein
LLFAFTERKLFGGFFAKPIIGFACFSIFPRQYSSAAKAMAPFASPMPLVALISAAASVSIPISSQQLANYLFGKRKCKACPQCGQCRKGKSKGKCCSIAQPGEKNRQRHKLENSEPFRERLKIRRRIEEKNGEMKAARSQQSRFCGHCRYAAANAFCGVCGQCEADRQIQPD